MKKDHARHLLKQSGLRVTAPRLAVISKLAEARTPLSFSDVLQRLGETDWDDATVYRNLVKLREVGIASVVSRAGGIDRYAFSGNNKQVHQHPHFVCDRCGRLACLAQEITMTLADDDPWAPSIMAAKVQLSGACPDCLATASS